MYKLKTSILEKPDIFFYIHCIFFSIIMVHQTIEIYTMWIYFLLLSILFFVGGQVMLRYDKGTSVLLSSSCFFMVSGLLGLLLFLYYNTVHTANATTAVWKYSKLGLLAGVCFFFGNLLWIYCIQNAPSLSLVRVIMAACETILLVIVGYLLFKEQLLVVNVVGFAVVLVGIYLALMT